MKTILAFETSTATLSVALGTREGKIRELRATGAFKHSENLIPLIDRLLKKERLSMADIDAFAIDRGPGSFTGLRIGFSLLKGFLAARKRPCYGAVSLDMMTHSIVLPEGFRLGVLMDARRDKIYSRFYRFKEGLWVAERNLEVLSLSGLLPRISPKTLLVGDGLERYAGEVKVKKVFPSARALVEWFQKKDSRLTLLKTPRDFSPLYFRASEAEEKRRSQ